MKIKKSLKISLDKFINLSLYDNKSGFYMKKNPFGKKGDFITAPNISRLFSEMIAIWIISFWKSLGSPKKFNLIELGAGNGEMMRVFIESFKSSLVENCEDRIKSLNIIKDLENSLEVWSYEKLNETDRISSYIKKKFKDYDFS